MNTDLIDLIHQLSLLPVEMQLHILHLLMTPVDASIFWCMLKEMSKTIEPKAINAENNEEDNTDHVAYHPDGLTFATSSNNGGIRIWDAKTGKIIHSLPTTQVRFITYSPDGSMLAAGLADWNRMQFSIKIWDTRQWEQIIELPTHGGIDSIAFSPDGTKLASISESGGLIWIWRTDTWREIIQIPNGIDRKGRRLAFSPNNSILAVGIRQGVDFFDTTTWNRLPTSLTEEKHIIDRSIAFSPDGLQLAIESSGKTDEATGMDTTEVIIWDTRKQTITNRLSVGDSVTAIAFSPDRFTLAVALAEHIKIFNAKTWELLSTISIPNPEDFLWISSIAYSPNGSKLLIGTGTLWLAELYDPQAQVLQDIETIIKRDPLQSLLLYTLYRAFHVQRLRGEGEIDLRTLESTLKEQYIAKYGASVPELLDLSNIFNGLSPALRELVKKCFRVVL